MDVFAPFFCNGGEQSKVLFAIREDAAAGAADNDEEGLDEDELDDDDEEEEDVFSFETFLTFDCFEALFTIFEFYVQLYDSTLP